MMATAANLPISALSTSLLYKNRSRNASELPSSPERRQKGITEVESVLNRSLRNENDLLRCQLNDLIHREKAQRIELQRLRQHRDAEVTSMVHSGTSQLKAEVKQLQNMLQSTSEQLLQTLSEREQARSQKEQCSRALEELRKTSSAQEMQLQKRLQSLEEAFSNSVTVMATLADTVDTFQRHVLPTFKPAEFEINKSSLKMPPNTVEGKCLMEQMTRLENGLALLRVIVDAKNDTLVMIRGKLKQENEELKAELQVAREATQGSQPQPERNSPPFFDTTCNEKNLLRQELQSLQNLFNEEVKQLKSKLKMYESEEQQGQGRLFEVQKELATLQNKLSSVEASRTLLEASLKEETSARSQLISQLFTLRKDNEKTKTELETLKLSQKFLVRQPRSGGRIPVEKMDLMNTVNQLLGEINKLKGEKVALEEELKTQKRSQVRDRIKMTVTSRDVELAASNKVGDTELASKLARARLQQLGLQESTSKSKATTPHAANDSSPSPILKRNTCSPLMQTELFHSGNGLQGTQSIEIPLRDDIMSSCAGLHASPLSTKLG